MGKDKTSTTLPVIPPELAGLFGQSAKGLQTVQGSLPLTGFTGSYPAPVADLSPSERLAAGAAPLDFQSNLPESLAMAYALSLPSFAGAGPTTGNGGLATTDLQSLLSGMSSFPGAIGQTSPYSGVLGPVGDPNFNLFGNNTGGPGGNTRGPGSDAAAGVDYTGGQGSGGPPIGGGLGDIGGNFGGVSTDATTARMSMPLAPGAGAPSAASVPRASYSAVTLTPQQRDAMNAQINGNSDFFPSLHGLMQDPATLLAKYGYDPAKNNIREAYGNAIAAGALPSGWSSSTGKAIYAAPGNAAPLSRSSTSTPPPAPPPAPSPTPVTGRATTAVMPYGGSAPVSASGSRDGVHITPIPGNTGGATGGQVSGGVTPVHVDPGQRGTRIPGGGTLGGATGYAPLTVPSTTNPYAALLGAAAARGTQDTGATPFGQSPGIVAAGAKVSPDAITNDPVVKAAFDNWKLNTLPGIQNQLNLSGLGRGTALGNAEARGTAELAAPLYADAAAREQARLSQVYGATESELNRRTASAQAKSAAVSQVIPYLQQLGQTQRGGVTQGIADLLQTGGTARSVAQNQGTSAFNDFLRRQGISEEALLGPFGQLGTAGQQTKTSNGSFK